MIEMKEFAKEVKKTLKKAYPDYYINLESVSFLNFQVKILEFSKITVSL